MASSNKKFFFILTGDPGVGKTTLIKKLASILYEKGIETTGFYTEETRKRGVREGFDVVSLDETRRRLARDLSSLSGPVKCKVGKYGVLVQEFEEIALPSLDKERTTQSVLIIDEIGKMEMFSEPFKSRVKNIFSNTSDCVVLATIPARRSDVLIENIRNHNRAKLWVVTKENRNNIHEEIMKDMKVTLNLF